uniref:Putative salivary lipocalin n=1 Tax=Rhodnius neglectus TaxID=72488 RepID=A0A0P4VN96_9HEMI
MKTILAVIFFGILTFAFADYPKLKECKPPEAMKGLDSGKFLSGTWYVTNAKHGSNSTVCREYKGKRENGIRVLNGDGYYSVGSQKVYFEVRCNKESDRNFKLTFSCTQSGSIQGNQVQFPFKLEVTVLSTDYEDFGIMYRCAHLPTGIEDNVLVLHRDATKTDDKKSLIKETLEKQNWTLDKFNSRKGVTCPEPPQK